MPVGGVSLCDFPALTSLTDYVLQRALSVVEGEQKEQLILKIKPQLTTMRRYSSAYSKHLVSSWSLSLALRTLH